MDLNLFRIDWERLAQVLTTIIVLSFFVERALAPIVESRAFLERVSMSGVKELLAFVLSMVVVRVTDFDALGILFHATTPNFAGLVITAAVISGGSKASIKLFHDVMNVKNDALREDQALKAQGSSLAKLRKATVGNAEAARDAAAAAGAAAAAAARAETAAARATPGNPPLAGDVPLGR